MRFWSQDGPDESVLRALAEGRLADLPRQEPSPRARREQLAAELKAALSHLRAVHASYWDRELAARASRAGASTPSTSHRQLPGAARRGRTPGRARRLTSRLRAWPAR